MKVKRAVVISFNWNTKETMHTVFEGENASKDAANWTARGAFIWEDFPCIKGWVHFYYVDYEDLI